MKNPVDLHIGKKLKAARIKIGISQNRLGNLAGITFQQIQKYEAGLNRISAGRLYQLSQILDEPISVFFEDCNYGHIDNKIIGNSNSKKTKDKEILDLIQSFNKINNSDLRKNIISLLSSISNII